MLLDRIQNALLATGSGSGRLTGFLLGARSVLDRFLAFLAFGALLSVDGQLVGQSLPFGFCQSFETGGFRRSGGFLPCALAIHLLLKPLTTNRLDPLAPFGVVIDRFGGLHGRLGLEFCEKGLLGGGRCGLPL